MFRSSAPNIDYVSRICLWGWAARADPVRLPRDAQDAAGGTGRQKHVVDRVAQSQSAPKRAHSCEDDLSQSALILLQRAGAALSGSLGTDATER
jgi:hypothetical protein